MIGFEAVGVWWTSSSTLDGLFASTSTATTAAATTTSTLAVATLLILILILILHLIPNVVILRKMVRILMSKFADDRFLEHSRRLPSLARPLLQVCLSVE
jgi:hypothetical protein